MRTKISLGGGIVGALLLVATGPARAETFEVGPGQAHAGILDVPLESLVAGDIVRIHWREEPYRERFGLDGDGTADAPIVIQGVPNAEGELPVIDGEGSTSGYNAHVRGLIHVDGGSYIVVENLELRNANLASGLRNNSSGIFAPGGTHLTFRNLHIHHNGNGFFSWHLSSDVLVEGCHIHDNGNVDSLYEHNVYTESDGIVFQFNVIGLLLPGARGNNLKDRSGGAVIRYNWIEGGNRCLDLVEAEDGVWSYADNPDFVYGNVLIKHDDTTQSQVVHFGGDNDAAADRTFLHFFHNTVYSVRPGNSTLFFVNANATVDARNNVFHASDGDLELIDPDQSSEATLLLGPNWIRSGWFTGSAEATVTGIGELIDGTDPGLAALPTDFRPLAGSPVIDAGGALAAGAGDHPALLEFRAQGQSAVRDDPGNPDLGAFADASAAGGGGAAGNGGAPSGGAAPSSGGTPATGGAAAGGAAGSGATSAGGGGAPGGASSAAGTPPTGGVATGGVPEVGGTPSLSGAPGSAGASDAGGAATAGASASGGRPSSGGASSGGQAGEGAAGTSGAGDAGAAAGSSDDGGCTCSVLASGAGRPPFELLGLLGALALRKRRRLPPRRGA